MSMGNTIYKFIASSSFLLVGIINSYYAYKIKSNEKKYSIFVALILSGLTFGMIGDILICYYFIIGAIFFAIGHLFYIAAYIIKYPFKLRDIVYSLLIFTGSVLFITLAPIFHFENNTLKLVSILYALIISFMLGKALSNLKNFDCVSIALFIGSALFFFSDLMLLLSKFSTADSFIADIFCISTYFLAQFIIASSIILQVEKGMNFYKKIYCRIFQFCLKIALPFLPYKDPKILDNIELIADEIKKNKKQKPLIITDKVISKLPVFKKLTNALEQQKIEYKIYDNVVANPTTTNVLDTVNIYKENKCDCLIAFGGGSVIDCAKATGALIARPKKTLNQLKGILKVRKKIPLLFAIPTTAGTGSEITLAAVIVDANTHHKYAINDFPLIPKYAVLDEETTSTLPKHIIATTGMDALTHAIEAFIGKGGNKQTRKDALDAAELIFNNLEKAYNGDKIASKNMLMASHKAGRAFSKAYVGYIHALAHPLGGKYNIAHGLANAIILPAVLKEYGKAVEKKLWTIAVHCKLITPNHSNAYGSRILIKKIEELNQTFNIPNTFNEIHLGDIDELVNYAYKEANPLYPVPVLWGKYELKQMYLKLINQNANKINFDNMNIPEILKKQKMFFESGFTLNTKVRLNKLKTLYQEIKNHLPEIHQALKQDLGKSDTESYMCETGLVLNEISYLMKHLKHFSKPKYVLTPLAQTLSTSYRLPSPYGNVLIISPWNYPFLLSVGPLVDAIAAGNTAIIKLSEYSTYTNHIIAKIINIVFAPEYVSISPSGMNVNESLMESNFNYIFFTGSKQVGKIIYQKAAQNLIPVTLELGGKSPCIIDETANIKLAAKRIVWGKFLNCGQTCVAPDYIFCSKKIHDQLITEIKYQIAKQFSNDPINNPSYGKIINEKHFKRIINLIDQKKVIYGGKINDDLLKIEPTIIDQVTTDDLIMQEEIFGPLLPIITYKEINEVIQYVQSHDSPLALYIFSSNHKLIKQLSRTIKYGGGCINDVVIHLATPYMPFGGVGGSGIGSYHGKAGFETFTHYKSIVKKSTLLDLPMRYQPFRKIYQALIKLFLH